MNARCAAFISLKKYAAAGKYLNIETDAAIRKTGLEGADKNLYTALVFGTAEKQITLDYIISKLSNKPLSSIDENVLIVLRMSIYQLMFFDRVPDHAVLNEAGELAKRFAKNASVSFVNAVLREFLRRDKKVAFPDKNGDFIYYLSITYSFPEWICSLFLRGYGKEKCEEILAAMQSDPPYMTLRANTLKISRDELIKKLSDAHIKSKPSPLVKTAVCLCDRISYEELESVCKGEFMVQDAASQIAVLSLGAECGDLVLDLCSAPGSKAFGAAMEMKNCGKIAAYDLHQSKISLIKNGAENYGITIIDAEAKDATKEDESLFEIADKVICDVPCSGLGVMQKKPDIRHKNPSDIERLPNIQAKILENAAKYTKKGGVILYSTCTLSPDENEKQIENFLSSHKDFSLCKIDIDTFKCDGMHTFFPSDGTDGFFIAKLKKIEA
ncbi:MAG: 16S rRNA (cytosine(967)-C(5))-methyltransferase RsmB [Clostridia bacterium]|nr:16S rRNA (cytosine(967)-C(5))-methyltransferase RsmB [Clostridia bacterium]